MKVRKFSSKLGKVFDPNKDFTSDTALVLIKHPTSPTEGATVGYVEEKLKEFYKDADIKGTINDINVIKLEGPEITHTAKELILKNSYSGPKQVVMVDVDSKGRVTKSYPLTSENLDPSVKVDISQVTGRPNTIEGYGIKDLASRNKFEKFTAIMTTEKHPRASKGPVPFSRLEEIWQESGYEMGVGDIVVKLKTPDLSKWVKAQGGFVERVDAPELVTFLAGEEAERAELPNCKVRDDYILNSFGVPGISYIKARSRGKTGGVIPIKPS